MMNTKEVLLLNSLQIFDRDKTSGSGIKNENISNKELDEELHKPTNRKFKKREVHVPFSFIYLFIYLFIYVLILLICN